VAEDLNFLVLKANFTLLLVNTF